MDSLAIDINEALRYARIDAEDTLGVESLKDCIREATALAEARINRKVVGDVSQGAIASTPEEVPVELRHAIKNMAVYLYENRGSTGGEIRDRLLQQAALDVHINY